MTTQPLDSDISDSSSQPFVIFKKFSTKESAQELTDILTENNIAFEREESSLNFEMSRDVNEASKEYRIKLKKQDFESAQHLIDQHSLTQLNSIDKDYPLFSFTDEELKEVLMKPDEWNALDPVLAQKILKDRGKEMTAEEVHTLKQHRLEELAKPETNHRWWIVIAYISALLGGLLGIFIGWHLSSHKKTLPNGDRVYSYSLKDRAHGQYIVIIGVVVLVIAILAKIIVR